MVLLFTDSRVRSRVVTTFKNQFKSIEEAEINLDLTILSILGEYPSKSHQQPHGVNKYTQTPKLVQQQQQHLVPYGPPRPPSVQEMDDLFAKFANEKGISTNPGNFVSIALNAMKLLEQHGKSNLIYKFAYCLATSSPITNKPLFDLSRMPFGMLEYQIEFFSSTNSSQVSVINNYNESGTYVLCRVGYEEFLSY